MKEQRRSHYIHRLNYSQQERLVGAFVLLCIAILLILLFVAFSNSHFFEPKVRYIAYLRNAEGLASNTSVRISGLRAGNITNIEVDESNRFLIELDVYERFQKLVRSDSVATVNRLAFIGDSVLNISPGSVDQAVIPDGGVLATKDTPPIDKVIDDLSPTLVKASQALDIFSSFIQTLPADQMNTLFTDMLDTTQELKTLAQQINSGEGTLGAMVYSNDMNQQFTTAIQQLNQNLLAFEGVVKNMDRLSLDSASAIAELPEIMQRITSTLSRLDQEVRTLPELSSQTRSLLDESAQVLDAISRTWPVSGKIQPTAPVPPAELPLQAGQD